MAITNGYATLDDAKAEMGVNDTDDDARIEMCVEAASRQIDSFTGRVHGFWQDDTVATREFYAESSRVCVVDDISTTTGLVVKIDSADNGFTSDATTLTITTDFVLRPLNAADESPVRPWTEILAVGSYSFPMSNSYRPGVQVTAKFGWPAVPTDVKKACLIQALQLFRSGDAVFGVASFGLDGGGLRVRESLNPIAAALLQRYVKEL